jgi:GDP/UDP-N,N'-diacetylbacillosamine 2-epimerase (hydrolysing)
MMRVVLKRKVCVITSSRADYGLLRLIMLGIRQEANLELQIIATGMHLSKDYGLTINEIESDGFLVNRKVPCLNEFDDAVSISRAAGSAISGCAEALKELQPDIILLLGDRFEILSAAMAGLLARIPIAHIHGGELTLGAFDESIRHAITKMSSIHFVTHEVYRRRVVQLGEIPERVYLVGSLGVDAINSLVLMNRKEIENELNIKIKAKSLLITFHPATLDKESPERQMNHLLSVLEKLNDTTLLFTMPNADTGGNAIVKLIEDFVQKRENAYAFSSLGQLLYLSCMAMVDGVVGNSSSGITEAPVMGIGTVNIGTRQLGRIQSQSIINCGTSQVEIEDALKILYSAEFCDKLRISKNSMKESGASLKILKVLKEVDLRELILKPFQDIPFSLRGV